MTSETKKRGNLPLVLAILALAGLGGGTYYVLNDLSSSMGTRAQAASSVAQSLHQASETGDVAAIEEAIRRGAKVDELIDDGTGRGSVTPLMSAAAAGQTQAIKALLSAGAAANARSTYGNTPLMLASGWGTAESVRALLQVGARPNDRNENRLTALMLAASRGELDSITALLDADADVNDKNKWGQSALTFAAQSGNAQKVLALVAAGASVNEPDIDGMTPLAAACNSTDGGGEVVTALLGAAANPNLADLQGVTPLMRAASAGDLLKVRELIKGGATVAAKDRDGRSSLDWAKSRDDDSGKRVVQELIQAGAK